MISVFENGIRVLGYTQLLVCGWAPPNWHLGTSPLLAIPSFLLGVLRVTLGAGARAPAPQS
jgi:hypothetical protein